MLSWDDKEALAPAALAALESHFGTVEVRVVARAAGATLVAPGGAPSLVPIPAHAGRGLVALASLDPDADARAAWGVIVEDAGVPAVLVEDDERVRDLTWRAFAAENRAKWANP